MSTDDLAHSLQGNQNELRETFAQLRQQLERVEEVALERTREVFQQAQLLNLSHDAIIIRTLHDDHIAFWNHGAELLYGWTKQEALGKVTHELLRSRFPTSLEAIDGELNRTGYWEGELQHSKRDGERRYVDSRWVLQRDELGNPLATLEINRDVTARKRYKAALLEANQQLEQQAEELQAANEELQSQAEELQAQAEELQTTNEKLRELDKLKNLFVYSISHELRTPLTAIFGYVELLEEQADGRLSEAEAEYVKQIEVGAVRLARLVDDLLDFARLEAGTFRLNLQPADLMAKVKECLEQFKTRIRSARVMLHGPQEPESIQVVMDPQRIGQVLDNLLSNALKFTPTGGCIWVRVCRQGDVVRLEVVDNGPGIPPEQQERLFQHFSQLEAGTRKGGTGLGLAISKSLVEAHKGQIGVESRPQEGSTFWFTLPLSPAAS